MYSTFWINIIQSRVKKKKLSVLSLRHGQILVMGPKILSQPLLPCQTSWKYKTNTVVTDRRNLAQPSKSCQAKEKGSEDKFELVMMKR